MSDKTSPALDIHTVDAARWADFERLFEGRGGPRNCWCTIYRATPDEARQRDKASRKAAMERRISAGVPVGLLAYQGGEPVAWCSIAPRATCRVLEEAAVQQPAAPGPVWSLACFYVLRRLRGQGIVHRLIAAAVEHARAGGARTVEAYPVDADAPSYRFGGFVETFATAGFREVGRLGTRRHVMRLELG